MQAFSDQQHSKTASLPGLPPVVETAWIALSGAACSGKSSTGTELVRRGSSRIPETMRVWMDGLKAEGTNIADLKAANLYAFRQDLFEVAHGIGESLLKDFAKQTLFFTRPGIDALAMMKADGLEYRDQLDRMRRGFRFSLICVFDLLPFAADGTRVNVPGYREKVNDAIYDIARELGYEENRILRVPAYAGLGKDLSMLKRVELIEAKIKEGVSLENAGHI